MAVSLASSTDEQMTESWEQKRSHAINFGGWTETVEVYGHIQVLSGPRLTPDGGKGVTPCSSLYEMAPRDS